MNFSGPLVKDSIEPVKSHMARLDELKGQNKKKMLYSHEHSIRLLIKAITLRIEVCDPFNLG